MVPNEQYYDIICKANGPGVYKLVHDAALDIFINNYFMDDMDSLSEHKLHVDHVVFKGRVFILEE